MANWQAPPLKTTEWAEVGSRAPILSKPVAKPIDQTPRLPKCITAHHQLITIVLTCSPKSNCACLFQRESVSSRNVADATRIVPPVPLRRNPGVSPLVLVRGRGH